MSSLTTPISQTAKELYAHFDQKIAEIAKKVVHSPDGKTSWIKDALGENSEEVVSVVVKVAVAALAIFSAWTLLTSPFVVLSAAAVGALVRLEPKTHESIMLWLSSAKELVFDPIVQNESAVEKLALTVLGIGITCLAATTIILPVSVGVYAGYELRRYLSKNSYDISEESNSIPVQVQVGENVVSATEGNVIATAAPVVSLAAIASSARVVSDMQAVATNVENLLASVADLNRDATSTADSPVTGSAHALSESTMSETDLTIVDTNSPASGRTTISLIEADFPVAEQTADNLA